MRAAGIHGDVAADRACELARRIGRVEEPGMRDRIGDGEIGDAGLQGRRAVEEIHIENAGHAGQADDDRIACGQRGSRQRGARPSGKNPYIIFTAKFNYPANFCRCSCQYNGKGSGPIGCQGVRLEGAESGFIAYNGIRSKRAREPVQDLLTPAKNEGIGFGHLYRGHKLFLSLRALPTRCCGCVGTDYIDTGTLSFVM